MITIGIDNGLTGGLVAIVGRPAYAMHQDEAEMDGITTAPTV